MIKESAPDISSSVLDFKREDQIPNSHVRWKRLSLLAPKKKKREKTIKETKEEEKWGKENEKKQEIKGPIGAKFNLTRVCNERSPYERSECTPKENVLG